MKSYTAYILLSLMFTTLPISSVLGSGPPPPLRALPEGAIMRIGQGQGVDFDLSPDGNQIAIACSFIGVWIHDVHTGSELALLSGHTDAVTSVLYSPDGSTIASGSYDKTVRLWDARTYQHIVTFTGHTGDTKALAFSPDGKTLATGASRSSTNRRLNRFDQPPIEPDPIDSTIRVWDLATKKQKHILKEHTGWISSLAFSPDGTFLASSSIDNTVRLWDTATGQHKLQLKAANLHLYSMEFSPDSTRLATWKSNSNVQLWDTHTGEQIINIEGCTPGATAFSPDSSLFVSSQGSGNSTIKLWGVRTGKQKAELIEQLKAVSSVTFSQDGLKIGCAKVSDKATFQWFDINNTKFQFNENGDQDHIQNPQISNPAQASQYYRLFPRPQFSSDRKTYVVKKSSYEIQIWDTHTSTQKTQIDFPYIRAHRRGNPFVAYSTDGSIFACGNGTKKIWVFDAVTNKYRATLHGHTESVTIAELSPDGSTLASACYYENIVRLWDINKGTLRSVLQGHSERITALTYSPDSTMLASGSVDGIVILWDAKTGNAHKTFKVHANRVPSVSVQFSHDGKIIASGCNSEIRVWDTFTGEQLYLLEGPSSFAFSPIRNVLATSDRWEIQLWDAYTGQHKRTLSGHFGDSRFMRFSSDGKLLVSKGETVQLWETETGKNITTLAEKDAAYILAFSYDNKLLAGSYGGSLRFWDVPLHQHIATFRGHTNTIASIAQAPINKSFATASYDGTIVLWKPVNVADENINIIISPSHLNSISNEKPVTFNIEITGGKDVAGYQLTLQYDATTLRYISSSNGDFLPGRTFFMKPIVTNNQVTLASTVLIGAGNGDGRLATVTFQVLRKNATPPRIMNLILSDNEGKRVRPTVRIGEVIGE